MLFGSQQICECTVSPHSLVEITNKIAHTITTKITNMIANTITT